MTTWYFGEIVTLSTIPPSLELLSYDYYIVNAFRVKNGPEFGVGTPRTRVNQGDFKLQVSNRKVQIGVNHLDFCNLQSVIYNLLMVLLVVSVVSFHVGIWARRRGIGTSPVFRLRIRQVAYVSPDPPSAFPRAYR